jgi:7-cyano-7-deazaguanine synthase in queuosine biosynthesis
MKVLMFSGGVDSLCAYFFLKKVGVVVDRLLYVALGHRYQRQELNAISRIALFPYFKDTELIIETGINLGKWEQPDAYIPLRNLFLACVGSLYGNEVYFVFQEGEQSIPDRTRQFTASATNILSYLHSRQVYVKGLFMDMTKVELVKWYLENVGDVDLISETFSCFNPIDHTPCKRCGACFRKWVAFKLNNLPIFDIDTSWHGLKEYKEKALRNEYGDKRSKEILQALSLIGL